MVNSDLFVQKLFDKAGIIRCQSRNELIILGSILQVTQLKPQHYAVITHAGGPGVIVTDTLTQGGLSVPDFSEKHQESLKNILYPGAATANPIDILATGTAEQLEQVISYCENEVDEIDAMIVIFGSPGLTSVKEAFQVIHEMTINCSKPLFAILPSVVNVIDEIKHFIRQGHSAFPDEFAFAKNLVQVVRNKTIVNEPEQSRSFKDDDIRSLVNKFSNGFLQPHQVHHLLQSAGIPVAKQVLVKTKLELLKATASIPYPLVQKVIGPLHKSDQNGVFVNVLNERELMENYSHLMKIEGAEGVMIQEMIRGKEVFIGAKRERGFPALVMCGAGGIYIEVLNDNQSALVPISKSESIGMVDQLKIKPILQGMRGEAACDLEAFYKTIQQVSRLLELVPEISELDLNPLMLSEHGIVAVDARIKIDKTI